MDRSPRKTHGISNRVFLFSAKRLRVAAPIALVVASACGSHHAAGPNEAAKSPVEFRASEGKPRLSLVVRNGDPFAAVGVAVVHDLGGVASIWLAGMLQARLNRTGGDASQPTVSSNGFVLREKITTLDEARRYVTAVRAALAAPMTDDEFVRVRDVVRTAPPLRNWSGAAEAAVADCIGELGAPAAAVPAKARVEGWRTAVFSAENVAFAAVGSRAVLDAVEKTIRDSETWPKGVRVDDPWPKQDVAGLAPNGDRARTLSVALRLPDAAKALEAAKSLGKSDSPLVRHARALETAWRVDRVVGTVRARGACLRLDLRPDGVGPVPAPALAAEVAAMTIDEATRALHDAPGLPGTLDSGVLASFDPRDAAAVAAWRALGGRLEPGPVRSFVSYGPGSTPLGPGADAAFERAVSSALATRHKPTLESKRAVESGQGETWILLGSPCATLTETQDDAGSSALLVRAIALSNADEGGVRVEPWISGEGVGLLAHGARLSPEETSSHQAERIAGALGRALSGARVDALVAATARAELENDLNAEAQPLWATALGILAPGRTSLLDPRGTWQSVTSIPVYGLEARRLAFTRGPLRLAVLANGSADDSSVELALERWLQPERRALTKCPAPPPLAVSAGEYVVDTPTSPQGSRALVAVPVAATPGDGLPGEAEWTLHLLNRHGGYLDRSVRLPGVAVVAEAALVGGVAGGALVVQVATSEGHTRDAVAQVRALFSRLADGAVTADDVQLARNDALEAQVAARADPRHRVISLWLGRGALAPPDVAALRRFQRQTLAPDRHIVVVGKSRP